MVYTGLVAYADPPMALANAKQLIMELLDSGAAMELDERWPEHRAEYLAQSPRQDA